MAGWGDTEDTLPSIEELTGPVDGRSHDEAVADLRHALGIGARRVTYDGGGRPDVHGLAEEMGLR